MDASSRTISVFPATEADLEKVVQIQFAAIGPFETEQLLAGGDTLENQALMISRHAEHLRSTSDLAIVKAELSDANQLHEVVGFCMFYFPNSEAATPDERPPLPLRPLAGPPQAPWIDDPVRRQKAQAMMGFAYRESRKYVAGRECGYVRYMCVDPSHQRQGVGKSLMEWGCRRFDEKKIDAYLEATPAGEGLYSRYGFERIGSSKLVLGGGTVIEYSHMWRNAR